MWLKRFSYRTVSFATMCVLITLLWSCSSTKHVPDGKYLLDDVKINITDNKSSIKSSELNNYLRQLPNHKVLWGVKLQLGFYNLSGKDSTKWVNKWLRRLGNAPVIYDSDLTEASAAQLRTALKNKGYLNSVVTYDTIALPQKKKMKVVYNITPNLPHYISSIDYNIPNDSLREIILADSSQFLIKPNSIFNRTLLDNQRQNITDRLRDKGYYAFNKEYITFTADTALNQRDVRLTMNVGKPYKNDRMSYYTDHESFYIRNVTFITNYDPVKMHDDTYSATDTLYYKGLYILYDNDDNYISKGTIEECCWLKPTNRYDATNVTKTYQAFSRLSIIKYINIQLEPVGSFDGKLWLDAKILLSKAKTQSVSLSLEGTNSAGDLGFGIGAGYQHRNAFKGSEVFNAKIRASYESLSGNLSGLINNNFSEYTGDFGITFPKFKAPFFNKNFKRRILATTELNTNFTFQQRPEYTRIIAGAGWKYVWTEPKKSKRHTFDLIDISYLYLPKSKSHFLDSITNPLLKYSYTNHLIMRMGYSFYKTNRKEISPTTPTFQPSTYTLRFSSETAGNVLYGISKLLGQKRKNGAYEIFGIRYAQYFKFDVDYAYSLNFSPRHSLAFHIGAGAAIPYGNASVVPFEKRFYAGGANSVRGWGVRTLGPGSYDGTNSVNQFIYQCGDIRLDMNIEYRAKLFWVIAMAAFIDAGNIWTIRDYEDQPGGVFKFNSFYKQIALSYGAGIRLDFNYFLVRFDLGMKAHNPAKKQEPWPLIHPKWKRDATFHFSIGYPF